ncbi:unnamed protein product [Gemmata massiliana]|uniref:Uncharacterized protein n=1 Tax=Gemmata massiliana TaxID=1210884 RepID=A0A6P2CT90_9BACT|nr:hypothetical protein [Gemmata massiliana]VTR92151.1 unnamed protein product [Gemmata massiliana]
MAKGGVLLGDAMAIWNGIKSTLPFLEDEATVTVHLSPKGTRRDGYFLAAALGFSLVRRYDILAFNSPPPGMIMIVYDAASNAVQFTVRYRTCMTTGAIVNAERMFSELPVYTGPTEIFAGEAWNFISSGIPGVPDPGAGGGVAGGQAGFAGALAALRAQAQVPKLPFAKHGILARSGTTLDPNPLNAPGNNWVESPNPRPSGDQRSRGTLYQMVYAALTTPQGSGFKLFPQPVNPEHGLTGG